MFWVQFKKRKEYFAWYGFANGVITQWNQPFLFIWYTAEHRDDVCYRWVGKLAEDYVSVMAQAAEVRNENVLLNCILRAKANYPNRINTKNPLNYGNLSPQNRIYQSFCGDFFSIILMVFIIKISLLKGDEKNVKALTFTYICDIIAIMWIHICLF